MICLSDTRAFFFIQNIGKVVVDGIEHMDQCPGKPPSFVKHIVNLQPGRFYNLFVWAGG